MKDVFYLLFNLLSALARIIRPGQEHRPTHTCCPLQARSRQPWAVLAHNPWSRQGQLVERRPISRRIHYPEDALDHGGDGSVHPQDHRLCRACWKCRWKANLRVLEIEEIKSLPHVPMSHPFVERLIGSIRRELLDQTFLWTATDLENKLRGYQAYYTEYRCHSSRGGATPVQLDGDNAISLYNYRWKKHCRGLFQLPVAA